MSKFQALLDTMAASDMPETAQYRMDVTKWCNYVLEQARTQDQPEAVEEAVGMGQVEELIEMAEDEMVALEAYLKVRMWELVEANNAGAGPTIDFDPNPLTDPFGPGGNPVVAEKLRQGMEAMKVKK
jgi:NADH dehydrogenase (ubiquinone) 1 alpha subcomplex subunit 5